jgi:nitroreductase
MDILKHTNMDFEDFFSHRFSIRNYSGAKIDENLIRKALEISEKTPSQCNRQPWYNAVVSNKDLIDQLISLQQGGRQFKNDISHAVVVCGKYTHFYGSEHHQPFVSAGMYAMSLLLAFHSLGLGAIPLNLGIDIKRINKIQKLLDLPDGCFPVLIVGVGDINEEIKVAFAERFKYTEYTKFYI